MGAALSSNSRISIEEARAATSGDDAGLDAWSKSIQREFSARLICFRGRDDHTPTEEAMLWYARARKSKESAHGCSIEHYGVPVSAEHAARAQATYAELAKCMIPVHSADALDVRYGTLQACVGAMLASRATEEIIDRMCGYYCMGAERSQQWMAERLEMSPRTLDRHMGRLESVMRSRFQACGLIP